LSDNFNTSALAKRAALPASNAIAIEQLRTMPPYFGWVDCDTGHGKFRMFLGGNDDGIALRFFWNGYYEKTTLKAWSWLAKRTELALDIGAHTGVFSLAAKSSNPGAAVVSFEPHFMNFARLNLNLRANGFETVNGFMCAVGEKNEKLSFSVSASPDWLSSGGSIGRRPNAHTTFVQVVSVDSRLPPAIKAKVGLVKIDTEGFEAKCLDGMKDLLAKARPIIFFECVEAKSAAAVERRLGALGYAFFEVDDNQGTISPVAGLQPHLDSAGKPVYGKFNRIAMPEGNITAQMIG